MEDTTICLDDPTISIIKMKPLNARYWDTDGYQMINLLKMIASVATGKNLVTGIEGVTTL